MLISYNWLKQIVDFNLSPSQLDHTLTMLGIEVEAIIDYNQKYLNFFTAKVLTKEKHPKADKLSLCTVDFGKDIVNVVCGASNVQQGQVVVFGTIGAVVPNGGFKLEPRSIRGFNSNGMICGEVELDLGSDSSGIMVLPDDTPIGLPIAQFLGLDDIIIEISITPNRADCLSHFGIAREIAAFLGTNIKYPDFNLIESNININDSINVKINNSSLCQRYAARIIRNLQIKESPIWLKNYLNKLGFRPVNIAVDVTNFVLLECGHPLHAFDLNKINGSQIIIDTANNNDTFITLDDKNRKLDNNMLMINDSNGPIAIAGVMGGANTEIKNDTTDILLESAYFLPTSIRKTAKMLGINSEASYRFERGVDIDNVIYALDRAAALIAELTGATIDKHIIDCYPQKLEPTIINLRCKRANDIIGINISNNDIKSILSRLNFKIIDDNQDSVTVQVPSYRVDIFSEIDLIEEVARLYNYDNIDPQYNSNINLNSYFNDNSIITPAIFGEIKDYLIKSGFQEILTQNQTDPKIAALFSNDLVRIANPLGEELSVMKPSSCISMLKTIEHNIRMGNPNLKLFELAKSFHKVGLSEKTFLPGFYEKNELIIAISGNAFPKQWSITDNKFDFYEIKGIAENLFAYFKYTNIKYNENQNEKTIFSANSLSINYKNVCLGYFGEISSKLLKHFELEVPVFAIIIDLDSLQKIDKKKIQYNPVAPYPGISRDLAFVIDENIKSSEIKNLITEKGGKLLKAVSIFDVYSGKSIGENKKSIGFSLYFSSSERTLTDNDIDENINDIIKNIENKFTAKLRKF